MQLSDFDFDLPDDLIAQSPATDRAGSRLLEVEPDRLTDRQFRDLPSLLSAGDLLVVNDTKVLRARLLGSKANSGGRFEALIERVTGEFTALSMLRASKTPRAGTRLRLDPASGIKFADDRDYDVAEVAGRHGEFFLLSFSQPVLEVLQRCGRTPLPPYIRHNPDAHDEQRYQTVYAREIGAVAAPTAGLHFDDALFEALRERGIQRAAVTLHVGAGTFQPVRVEDLSQHVMHQEFYQIPNETVEAVRRTRAAGGRIVAVGTTSLRALESASSADGQLKAGAADTRLFITPGYRFRTVDRLITNFHLPRSTLLMLVSAFAGIEPIRRAYRHAIEHQYRFFSYGDAMLLTRQPPPSPENSGARH